MFHLIWTFTILSISFSNYIFSENLNHESTTTACLISGIDHLRRHYLRRRSSQLELEILIIARGPRPV